MRLVFSLLFSIWMIYEYTSCAPSTSDPYNQSVSHSSAGSQNMSPSELFVASGTCYAGGVTTSTGSNTVVKYDSNGNFKKIIVDYNQLSPGDSPVGLSFNSQGQLLIAVENTSGRRIDIVNQDGSGLNTYLSNSTALSAQLRSVQLLPDSSLLISKSSAIEKFSSAKARILSGANPYVSAPAGVCATSTTLISKALALPNGKIVYTHAAATPNNLIGVISSTGYSVLADCLKSQAAPTTTALPSAMIYTSTNKLIVTYGSTTNSSNFIYSYDIDQNTNTFSGITNSFNDFSIINGPSAIAEDRYTSSVYISNANSAFNNIEKFTYDPVGKILTRVGSAPFIPTSIFTKCVSAMVTTP